MKGVGINDEPDRNAFTPTTGYPPIVAPLNHVAALTCKRPVIAFSDQDQRGNGHVALQAEAWRIKRDRGTELIWRGLLHDAVFDRAESERATLRKTQHHDARGIDEWLLHQEVQRPIRIEGHIDWRAAAAGVLDAAWTKAVDGERHIAPGCDPHSPALVEPPPISVATMQQHHSGRGTSAIRSSEVALQRLWAGKRIFEFH